MSTYCLIAHVNPKPQTQHTTATLCVLTHIDAVDKSSAACVLQENNREGAFEKGERNASDKKNVHLVAVLCYHRTVPTTMLETFGGARHSCANQYRCCQDW